MKKDLTKYRLIPTSYATGRIARLRSKLWIDRVMYRDFERQKQRITDGMTQ